MSSTSGLAAALCPAAGDDSATRNSGMTAQDRWSLRRRLESIDGHYPANGQREPRQLIVRAVSRPLDAVSCKRMSAAVSHCAEPIVDAGGS
jgi:hypothetical protein